MISSFSALGVGKVAGNAIYLHVSALPLLPLDWQALYARAVALAQLTADKDFNVIKFHESHDELSLLAYPDFFDDPFPALARSWRVSLVRGIAMFRSYEESRNPPILHRKELLLASDDPRIAVYRALTDAAESLGLFTDRNRIGFREPWLQMIAERGYELVDGQFLPVANAVVVEDGELHDYSGVRRHLTALSRTNFSAPVQALCRHGLITSERTFFDYGCGRGDDVRGLVANGIDASGWDPFYAPDAAKRTADIVNLGFVINVIEDFGERVEALRGAFACANGVLSVAAMLTSQSPPEGRLYRDGFLSMRNTFQKYFSQAQLRDFIEHTLDDNAVAVGPGVFFVFKDKNLEQNFLSARYGQRTHTILSRGWAAERRIIGRRTSPQRPSTRTRVDRTTELFEKHEGRLRHLWIKCVEFGRLPARDEIEPDVLEALQADFGSYNRIFDFIRQRFDTGEFERARRTREADLLVLFALHQFQKRRPYRHLEQRLQADIRHFFGDYATCQAAARQALFGIGDLVQIDAACRQAAENGFGWLDEGHSLQLHASLLERLPTILRVYVGCATVLCGDISEFDMIKIHIRSGKVTLMKFDDFENSPLPRLQQRIKVNLRDQDLDVFAYGEGFPPTLLYHKARYINEEFPRYSEQLEFDEALDALAIHDLNGYGPSEVDFRRALDAARWEVEGFELRRSSRIPQLDESCGAYFTYRQLIECGETQVRTGIVNLPKEADSYTALHDLCSKVLDPVVDYFGMIKLTYGFCSPALAKQIPNRIAPELDQHAAHEKKAKGKFVCNRLGAACDFLVEDENMEEVAAWIYDNTPVDRIYIYGPDRPIHVSYSPTPAREMVRMELTANGRRVPKVLTRKKAKAAS